MANIYPQVIVFDPTNVGNVGMLGNDQTWSVILQTQIAKVQKQQV